MPISKKRPLPLFASLLALAASPAFAQTCVPNPGGGGIGPGVPAPTYIVKYKPSDGANGRSTRSAQLLSSASTLGGDAVRIRKMGDGSDLIRITSRGQAGVARIVAQLARRSDVEYIVPDHVAGILANPNDTYFPSQWALQSPTAGINAPVAWDSTTGANQIIAILDTGITAHPDLAPNVLPYGYDFVSDVNLSRDGDGRDANPTDPGDFAVFCGGAVFPSSWHGTQVAGIAAAAFNNNAGIAGVAPSAKILPVRVLGLGGQGNLSDIADAIRWAAGGTVAGVPTLSPAQTADVINLSVGWYVSAELSAVACGPVEQAAIDFANSQGVVVVAAAGNNNGTPIRISPASCNGVITVAASDINGQRAIYSGTGPGSSASNRGTGIDVTAPGKDNLTTSNNGVQTAGASVYSNFSGTSAAAPHVSGVVALMQAKSPRSPAEVLEILTNTDAPQMTCSGCNIPGPINAGAAVAALSVGNSPPVAAFNPVGSFRCGSGKVTFALGNVSTDPDGDIVGALWNFGNSTTSTLWSPSIVLTAWETRLVTLTVSDSHGNTSTTTQQLWASTSCTS